MFSEDFVSKYYPYRPREGDNEYITAFIRDKRSGLAATVLDAYSKGYYIVNSIILLVLVVHYKTAANVILDKIFAMTSVCSKVAISMLKLMGIDY